MDKGLTLALHYASLCCVYRETLETTGGARGRGHGGRPVPFKLQNCQPEDCASASARSWPGPSGRWPACCQARHFNRPKLLSGGLPLVQDAVALERRRRGLKACQRKRQAASHGFWLLHIPSSDKSQRQKLTSFGGCPHNPFQQPLVQTVRNPPPPPPSSLFPLPPPHS